MTLDIKTLIAEKAKEYCASGQFKEASPEECYICAYFTQIMQSPEGLAVLHQFGVALMAALITAMNQTTGRKVFDLDEWFESVTKDLQ